MNHTKLIWYNNKSCAIVVNSNFFRFAGISSSSSSLRIGTIVLTHFFVLASRMLLFLLGLVSRLEI
jgi:hypothetical protein